MQELKELIETDYQRNSLATNKSSDSQENKIPELDINKLEEFESEEDIKQVIVQWFQSLKQKNETWVQECKRLKEQN